MTVQGKHSSWWSLGQQLDEYTKHEKCRNITEEIYKRINMFEVKKTESDEKKSNQSDVSDNSSQIDSNELSNETDLFACDKSDISSSEPERAPPPPHLININNNNEDNNKPVYKRPKKRFRKRVKKRPPNRKRSDSEGSSDEAPLARSSILSPDQKPKPTKQSIPQKNLTLRDLLKASDDDVKIPTVVIEKMYMATKETDEKKETIDKNTKVEGATVKNKNVDATDKKEDSVAVDKKSTNIKVTEWKSCTVCNLSFRGERGLRRHMSMTHITAEDKN